MLPEKKRRLGTTLKEADLRGWNRKGQHFNLDVLEFKVSFKGLVEYEKDTVGLNSLESRRSLS